MRIEGGQHVTTVGIVGGGKTFFNRNALLPVFDRIIVLDSEEDDYPDFPNVSVDKAIKLAKSNFSFAVRVPTVGDRKFDEPTLEKLSEGLLAQGHDLVLLIEEATDYSDASYIPPYLRALMRRARHRDINVIVSTQRLQMLSKDYFALSVHHVYFFLSDYDCERVKDYAPFLKERMGEIPYQSYRSLYQGPDGNVIVLKPAEEYEWESRLKRR